MKRILVLTTVTIVVAAVAVGCARVKKPEPKSEGAPQTDSGKKPDGGTPAPADDGAKPEVKPAAINEKGEIAGSWQLAEIVCISKAKEGEEAKETRTDATTSGQEEGTKVSRVESYEGEKVAVTVTYSRENTRKEVTKEDGSKEEVSEAKPSSCSVTVSAKAEYEVKEEKKTGIVTITTDPASAKASPEKMEGVDYKLAALCSAEAKAESVAGKASGTDALTISSTVEGSEDCATRNLVYKRAN